MSFQEVVDCEKINCPGKQWYCTQGLCGKKSGACGGDSGGPSWTFGKGKEGFEKFDKKLLKSNQSFILNQ